MYLFQENVAPKKPSASKGLFEDDDDLFGSQQQEAPSVDLFGPSSPIKQKSNPLVKEVRVRAFQILGFQIMEGIYIETFVKTQNHNIMLDCNFKDKAV